jgi:hypothetical protein
VKNKTTRKVPAHESGVHKRKHGGGAAAPPAAPPFDPVRWKAFRERIEVAENKMKAAHVVLRPDSQNREALRVLRTAVQEKYAVYHEMYAYQHGTPSKEDSAENWWSIAPAYDLFRNGDVAELETMIQFLERDSWFHGSGYLKEKLSHLIKPEMLSPRERIRLQQVCLMIVDTRDGREFRSFCNLARKVDSPEMREELMKRQTNSSADIQRRASWILEATRTRPLRQRCLHL